MFCLCYLWVGGVRVAGLGEEDSENLTSGVDFPETNGIKGARLRWLPLPSNENPGAVTEVTCSSLSRRSLHTFSKTGSAFL